MKNWIWWWRQNWNGATISIRTSKRGSAPKSRKLERKTDFSEGIRLLVWSTNIFVRTKLESVEPWQKETGNILTPSGKTGECFQRKTIGSCSRRDICSFLHTHATRDRETKREKVGEDARRSRLEQASSSAPKVKEQTDVKSSNSLEASPATGVKKSLFIESDMQKDRRVIIGILPCVVLTSLETDALMAVVAFFDMLMVRRDLPRGREKNVLKKQLLFWREKKNPRLCISKLRSNEFYSTESWRNWDWTLRRDTIEILRMQLGTELKFEKRWPSWAKSLRARFLRNNSLEKPHDTQVVPAKQRGICREKIHKLTAEDKATFYSLVQAPETQKIVCLLLIL